MSDDGFPLPGSSYEELTKIIQAYSHTTAGASLRDISSRTGGLHTTTISKNSRFLAALNIIEGGQKKVATALCKQLGHALEHHMPEEMATAWHAVIEPNEFMQQLLSAIRIRRGMDRSALQAHVAYSSGQSKSSATMTGAGTIVDILLASGVVVEANDKLVLANTANSQGSLQPHNSVAPPPAKQTTTPVAPITPSLAIHTQELAGGIALSIQIQVQCTIDDIDNLGDKIRNLIKSLEDHGDPNVDNSDAN